MPIRYVDLQPYLNALVATYDTDRPAGMLNAWGNSFPAEELPLGSTLSLGGVDFRLPEKVENGNDSMEPLGQVIELGSGPPAVGASFLCCGEMGLQRLPVRASGPGHEPLEFVVEAGAVMRTPQSELGDNGLLFTHLHYPGDYDLALAVPALYCFSQRWEEPFELTRLELGTNPLFHLLGISLLEAGADHE